VSIAQRLVGAWRLISFEVRRPDGGTRHPFGVDARGLLIYTANGYMAGQVMRPGRELADAAAGYIAYTGTYTANEAEHVVTHHVTMSLRPDLIGTDQRRHVVFEGERLTLSTPPDEGRVMILVWDRC
jgi:hypothetical protein